MTIGKLRIPKIPSSTGPSSASLPLIWSCECSTTRVSASEISETPRSPHSSMRQDFRLVLTNSRPRQARPEPRVLPSSVKRHLASILILAIGLLLGRSDFAQKVKLEYDHEVDCSKLRKYDWKEHPF